MEAYGDSVLVINQIKCEFEVHYENLIPYHKEVIKLANSFEGFYISHVFRRHNTEAYALAALATSLASSVDIDYHVTLSSRRLLFPKHNLEINEVHTAQAGFEPRDWRFPLIDYVLHDILPDDPKEAVSMR